MFQEYLPVALGDGVKGVGRRRSGKTLAVRQTAVAALFPAP